MDATPGRCTYCWRDVDDLVERHPFPVVRDIGTQGLCAACAERADWRPVSELWAEVRAFQSKVAATDPAQDLDHLLEYFDRWRSRRPARDKRDREAFAKFGRLAGGRPARWMPVGRCGVVEPRLGEPLRWKPILGHGDGMHRLTFAFGDGVHRLRVVPEARRLARAPGEGPLAAASVLPSVFNDFLLDPAGWTQRWHWLEKDDVARKRIVQLGCGTAHDGIMACACRPNDARAESFLGVDADVAEAEMYARHWRVEGRATFLAQDKAGPLPRDIQADVAWIFFPGRSVPFERHRDLVRAAGCHVVYLETVELNDGSQSPANQATKDALELEWAPCGHGYKVRAPTPATARLWRAEVPRSP